MGKLTSVELETTPMTIEDLEIVVLDPVLEIETKLNNLTQAKEIEVKKGNASVLQTEVGRLHLLVGEQKVDLLRLLTAIEKKTQDSLTKKRNEPKPKTDLKTKKKNNLNPETDLKTPKKNNSNPTEANSTRETVIDGPLHLPEETIETINERRKMIEKQQQSQKPKTDTTSKTPERKSDEQLPVEQTEDPEIEIIDPLYPENRLEEETKSSPKRDV